MIPALASSTPRRIAAALNLLLAAALLYLAGKIGVSARFSLVVELLVGGFVALALLSAAAGIGLWRGTALGAFLTLIVQGTQLVQSQTQTLTYTSSLPVSLVVGIGSEGGFRSRGGWRPALEITPDDVQDHPWVGLNLPALAAMVIAASSIGRRSPALRKSP
jgi:hypothetical protein